MPVMSDGIRSGVNWMRLKSRSRISASVLISSVLARPGHAGDQAVAAGEERDQHLLDDLVLPDDDLAQLGEDALAPFGDPLRAAATAVLGRHRVGCRSHAIDAQCVSA